MVIGWAKARIPLRRNEVVHSEHHRLRASPHQKSKRVDHGTCCDLYLWTSSHRIGCVRWDSVGSGAIAQALRAQAGECIGQYGLGLVVLLVEPRG
jgi:hypothetical protein